MAEWLYLIHPPRDDFIATINAAERDVFGNHVEYLDALLTSGVLILAGPTYGRVNTGITVIEADDEDAARAVMEADPAVSSGVMTGELREMGVGYLRGRA
jgi:uncharacterized protein YciI